MIGEATAITGIGLVTPLGVGTEPTWQGLCAGRSSVGLARIDASLEWLPTRIAAQVDDDQLAGYLRAHIPTRLGRRSARFTHLGLAAADMAVTASGLRLTDIDQDRVAVVIGTGAGGMSTVARAVHDAEDQNTTPEEWAREVDTLVIVKAMANSCPAQVSILFGIKGPATSVATSCSSGASALCHAHDLLQLGRADVVLAGGAEAMIDAFTLVGFTKLTALSSRMDDPAHASRPFDRERDGFVLGEGAAVMVLERASDARRRGARIYARLLGYGSTSDASHLTSPSHEGMARAMVQALREARVPPDAVDYVSAHGTSTRMNDATETAAIKRALGPHAQRVWVSSQKSMLGHAIGAAGAIEAAVTALSISHGVVTPTINYEHRDPECDLDYVPNVTRERRLRVALSNSFGFGGHNVSIVLAAGTGA